MVRFCIHLYINLIHFQRLLVLQLVPVDILNLLPRLQEERTKVQLETFSLCWCIRCLKRSRILIIIFSKHIRLYISSISSLCAKQNPLPYQLHILLWNRGSRWHSTTHTRIKIAIGMQSVIHLSVQKTTSRITRLYQTVSSISSRFIKWCCIYQLLVNRSLISRQIQSSRWITGIMTTAKSTAGIEDSDNVLIGSRLGSLQRKNCKKKGSNESKFHRFSFICLFQQQNI